MKIIIFLVILNFVTYNLFAGDISAPPPLPTEPVAEQHYLQSVYENINIWDIVTSAPDGTLKGKKGQPVLYNNSGTYTLWVNVDGATDWQQI